MPIKTHSVNFSRDEVKEIISKKAEEEMPGFEATFIFLDIERGVFGEQTDDVIGAKVIMKKKDREIDPFGCSCVSGCLHPDCKNL